MTRTHTTPTRPVRYHELPKWCSVRQVGTYLQVCRHTVYTMIAHGTLPAVRDGRAYRVPKTALKFGAGS
jgi:excisionase family DNA binding protein